MVNRTLISTPTNKQISNRSPQEYLGTVVPVDRAAEILASHYIDARAREAMRDNQFETFLKQREKALINELTHLISG